MIFQNISMYFPIYQDIFNFFKIFPTFLKYFQISKIQIFPTVSNYFHQNFSKYLQILTVTQNISESFIFFSKFFKIFQKISKFFKIFQKK